MNVRLIQLDGKLPNIALMKLAHWHRAQGDEVVLSRSIYPQGEEPLDYDQVYASSIEPFVMVYDRTRTDLICMARWANRGLYRIIPWPDYIRRTKSDESVAAYYREAA